MDLAVNFRLPCPVFRVTWSGGSRTEWITILVSGLVFVAEATYVVVKVLNLRHSICLGAVVRIFLVFSPSFVSGGMNEIARLYHIGAAVCEKNAISWCSRVGSA